MNLPAITEDTCRKVLTETESGLLYLSIKNMELPRLMKYYLMILLKMIDQDLNLDPTQVSIKVEEKTVHVFSTIFSHTTEIARVSMLIPSTKLLNK